MLTSSARRLCHSDIQKFLILLFDKSHKKIDIVWKKNQYCQILTIKALLEIKRK